MNVLRIMNIIVTFSNNAQGTQMLCLFYHDCSADVLSNRQQCKELDVLKTVTTHEQMIIGQNTRGQIYLRFCTGIFRCNSQ